MRYPLRAAVCVLCLLATATACGPRQTPEQRLQEIRLAHEILPVGVNVVHDSDGEPTIVVDLQVVNKGTVPLDHLTVMVRVRGEDGAEALAKRITLDLEGARPGVGVQVAALVHGCDKGENDEVTVELESNLTEEQLRSLPEFQDLP
jgi:hypothetical protein